MRLAEIINVIDQSSLVCIEDADTGECFFCCNCSQLTVGDLRPIMDKTVQEIYVEKYGKYYGMHGITIRIK